MPETPGPRTPFEDPDLQRRIFYTLGALAVYRVGTFIPVPGVDAGALKAVLDAQSGGPLGFLNALSGGALGRFSLLSLGVIPYVNAALVAGFALRGRDRRERDAAARRLTLVLAVVQSFALSLALAKMTSPDGVPIVADPGWIFYGVATLTLTAGALFMLWLCEEITESGIGGGALLIVFAGVVARIPGSAAEIFNLVRAEELGLFAALLIVAALLAAAMAAVWVGTAQRKLTVNYAQRVVGRRMYGGAQSSLPLKLDQSGVVAALSAAVFIASLSALPLAAAGLFPGAGLVRLSRGGWLVDLICAALIVLLCRFAASSPADSVSLAENLKKSGGSIPGVRPGDATAKHIQRIHERAALPGALFVAALAILPDLLRRIFRLPIFFDGVGLLIAVGVALDAMGRVEAHGLRRAYAKFLK